MNRVFYPELESLRGAAAFSVMVMHIIIITVTWGLPSETSEILAAGGLPQLVVTNLGLALFDGRSAVILFFVLSGFVMGANLDLRDGLRSRAYGGFLVRRFFRLMPVLWVAIVLALIEHHIEGAQYGLRQLIRFFTLLDVSIIPVSWTLVLELGVCLVYPLLLLAVRQMGIAAQLATLAAILWMTRWAPLPFHYGVVVYSWPLLAFYLGLVVPSLGRRLMAVLPRSMARAGLVLALLAYCSLEPMRTVVQVWPALGPEPLIVDVYLASIVVPLAAFYLIAWVLYSGEGVGVLHTKPLRFLGRVSYPVYVIHPTVLALFAFMEAPHDVGAFPIRLLLGLATIIPVTLLLSWAMTRWVEVPAIQFGKRVAAHVRLRRAIAPA